MMVPGPHYQVPVPGTRYRTRYRYRYRLSHIIWTQHIDPWELLPNERRGMLPVLGWQAAH